MPIGITVDIEDQATPLIERLGEAARSPALKKSVAANEQRLFSRHFRKLEAERHRHGGTNFYGRAARATKGEATADGVTVSIHQRGIAQRFLGGIIRPREAKALAIPVHPDAYGKRAGDPGWGDTLVFVPTLGGGGTKSLAVLVRQRQNEDFGTVMYVLMRQVRQKPDPTVLPDDAAVAETAIDAIERFIARAAARQEGGAR